MAKKLFTEIEPENPFAKLYSWEAPERVWTKKTRAWYVSYSFFFVVLIGVLALVGEYVLIVAIIAFVFLWFTQAAVPPLIVEQSVTTLGLRAFKKLFRWRDIKHFWFSTKDKVKFMNLEIIEDDNPRYNKRISLIVNEGDDKALFDILIQYTDYGEKDEIGFNPLMQILHGKYIPVSNYLPEPEVEPETLEYANEAGENK